MEPRKLTLYDVTWQEMRTRCAWATYPDVVFSINKLRTYLWDRGQPSYSKLWRVLNLLNAVRMGYHGMKIVGSPQDCLVVEFRDEVSSFYKSLDGPSIFEIPTSTQIERDWIRLTQGARVRILASLQSRLSKHSESKHREELRWFLGIVDPRGTVAQW
jgi:hypothetical protein